MSSSVIQSSNYAQLNNASANVFKGQGRLAGIFVSSVSGTPTITVYDDPSTGTGNPIVAQFTPVAGTWYDLPYKFGQGLFVAIGATVQCTVGYLSGG
jgi:hypothetical protein